MCSIDGTPRSYALYTSPPSKDQTRHPVRKRERKSNEDRSLIRHRMQRPRDGSIRGEETVMPYTHMDSFGWPCEICSKTVLWKRARYATVPMAVRGGLTQRLRNIIHWCVAGVGIFLDGCLEWDISSCLLAAHFLLLLEIFIVGFDGD
jgi:hypothetical protein